MPKIHTEEQHSMSRTNFPNGNGSQRHVRQYPHGEHLVKADEVAHPAIATGVAINHTGKQAMKVRWEHTHQCRKCGHVIRVDDIELKAIATGVITCQKCEVSGPVNVKIVEEKLIANPSSASNGNRQ